MTQQESAAAPRPEAHHIRAWRPAPGTAPGEPGTRAHDTDPQVGRVAACALGLAYAQREDVDGLQELVAIAEADEQVLTAARHRLASVGVVDDATRQRADTLLYTAVGHLDRLLT
jgi:hypothetical protein